MNKFRVFRASKTKVDNKLPSFNTEQKDASEDVKKEEAEQEEHDVAGMFEEIFGEQGEKVDGANISVRKPHVRRDDESDDEIPQEEEPQPKYSGKMVDEGVEPSKVEGEDAELDDLIADVMGAPAEPEPATSTPSKDDVKGADFGLSLIRGDDEPVQDKQRGKPSYSGTRTTTTVKTSYSSKFVPTIPASFYKDLQTRLEDLIFKFECLDNEYAALQKISHRVYVETSEIKEKFSV